MGFNFDLKNHKPQLKNFCLKQLYFNDLKMASCILFVCSVVHKVQLIVNEKMFVKVVLFVCNFPIKCRWNPMQSKDFFWWRIFVEVLCVNPHPIKPMNIQWKPWIFNQRIFVLIFCVWEKIFGARFLCEHLSNIMMIKHPNNRRAQQEAQ